MILAISTPVGQAVALASFAQPTKATFDAAGVPAGPVHATREVLAEYGLCDDEISALVEGGVVAQAV